MKNKIPYCQYTIVQGGMATLSGLLQKVPRRFTGARQLANHKNLVYCMEHCAVFGESAEKRGLVPGAGGEAPSLLWNGRR
jgi:hypothetical protein